jgi:proliferating cell nuclear antigen
MEEKMAEEQKVRLCVADTQLFADCIRTINGLVTEARIKLSEQGLSILAIDPANVALVSFKMSKPEFLEWDVTADTEIGISLASLKEILGRAKEKDNKLFLEVTDNKLLVTIVGKNGKKREFRMSTLDLTNEKEQKMPDLKFTAQIVVDNTVLKEGILDVGISAESIAFSVNNNKLNFKGSGDVTKVNLEVDAVVNCAKDDKNNYVDVESKYSIEYLNKFTVCKIAKNAKIGLSNSYPIKISYINDKGTMSMEFVAAPRIENN